MMAQESNYNYVGSYVAEKQRPAKNVTCNARNNFHLNITPM